MKRICLLSCLIVFFGFSSSAPGVDPFGISIRHGEYYPKKDLKHFETGSYAELAAHYRFTQYFSVEGGVGYFETKDSASYMGVFLGQDARIHDKFKVRTMPVTITVKGILPIRKWDFYGLAGIGMYSIEFKDRRYASFGTQSARVSFRDTDTIFGTHLGIGINYNITPRFFVGAEGRYIWTQNAKFNDNSDGAYLRERIKLDGFITHSVVGFRF